tara:strand:+ start:191 stop:406 length:216 start_codon:yes stop_codon:yes gene_type:complete
MKGWTVVYSDGFPPAVELRRTVLDQHRIPAVVLNKKDSSYLFGYVELLVQDEDVIRAKALLDNKEALSSDS